MGLKWMNPGCGSSRALQVPVPPVAVLGEAVLELGVGVKELVRTGICGYSSILPHRGAVSPSWAMGSAWLVPARGSVSLPAGAAGPGQAWGGGKMHGAAGKQRREALEGTLSSDNPALPSALRGSAVPRAALMWKLRAVAGS